MVLPCAPLEDGLTGRSYLWSNLVPHLRMVLPLLGDGLACETTWLDAALPGTAGASCRWF